MVSGLFPDEQQNLFFPMRFYADPQCVQEIKVPSHRTKALTSHGGHSGSDLFHLAEALPEGDPTGPRAEPGRWHLGMTGRPEIEEGGGPGVAATEGTAGSNTEGPSRASRSSLAPAARGGRTRVLLVLSGKPSGSGSEGVAFPGQLRPPFPLQKSPSPREGPQACSPWETCSQQCSHQTNTGRPCSHCCENCSQGL